MSDRDKMVQFLRDKAALFRRLGEAHDTPLSPRMIEVARELETRAAEIEGRAGGGAGKQSQQGDT